MGWLLFLLFTAVPLAELLLIIEVGQVIGFWATVGVCLLTGFAGAQLARAQGLSVLQRIQRTTAEGRMPTRELLDGAMILVAGVLLVTPGYLTDAVGLLLLLPPIRALLRGGLGRLVARRVRVHTFGPGAAGPFGAGPRGPFDAHGPFGSGPFGPAPGPSPRSREPADDGAVFIPPERAPRPPRPKAPKVITVED